MRMRHSAASAAFAIACLCGLYGCDRTSAGTAGQDGGNAGTARTAAGDIQRRDTTARAIAADSTAPAVAAKPMFLPTLGATISVPSATLPPVGGVAPSALDSAITSSNAFRNLDSARVPAGATGSLTQPVTPTVPFSAAPAAPATPRAGSAPARPGGGTGGAPPAPRIP